ncbi:uncharacterized protein LOC119546058 [Drosophila subpulchrella]|uniref:uncharacterized protein LOC119546058 n=1 Tax=Drosophila subpulchrella TaxID=1486046 RepID=UPI0018A145B9|nr:uncharacterized protein LOC119546058 [Drosophila subpulchrella]
MTIILIWIFISFYMHWDRIKDISFEYNSILTDSDSALFVNSTGCRIRATKPFSDIAISFIEPFKPVICPRMQLFKAETIGGRNYLLLNISESELFSFSRVKRWRHIFCAYREFIRVHDFLNKYVSLQLFMLKDQLTYLVGAGQQNIRIWCWVDFARIIFSDVLFFLPPSAMLSNTSTSNERLSVMILGLDSISHMHYQRHFHKVSHFMEHLPHTEFWGYNRVGRNSYPNLIPLLSGKYFSELENSCYAGKPSFDKCHFLWDDFKAAGYSTVFSEDNESIGTFTHTKKGFFKQPTDYYLRPVMVEIDLFTTYNTDHSLECSGHRLYQVIYYDFIYKTMAHLQRSPFFSFLWHTQGIHDHFNYAKLIDEDYLRIMQHLKMLGIMNHTFILVLADHGFRMEGFPNTDQGQKEISQPLLIAIYPEWLPKSFPLAISNLEQNARSLITTYDLHETLKDLINLNDLTDINVMKRTQNLSNSRGISLFLPIPESRDCRSAAISHHYCLCEELFPISTYESAVQEAAQFVVAKINELIKPYPQCQRLKLIKVRAAFGSNGEDGRKKEMSQIMVRLETTPGDGHFDATILRTSLKLAGERSLILGGPVTRTNKYGHQSFCIQNHQIEMYCCCV